MLRVGIVLSVSLMFNRSLFILYCDKICAAAFVLALANDGRYLHKLVLVFIDAYGNGLVVGEYLN